MKHLFVPYELALKLKEKGFNESCFSWYLNGKLETKDSELFYFTHSLRSHKGYKSVQAQEFVSAPLYQQVVDWFRERHNIHIDNDNNYSKKSIYWNNGKSCGYKEKERIKKFSFTINRKYHTKYYSNLYEALNKAIEEALKLI